MRILQEVNIKRVSNGYILENNGVVKETTVHKDFGELITWIAFIFGEIGVGEEIELVKRKEEQ